VLKRLKADGQIFDLDRPSGKEEKIEEVKKEDTPAKELEDSA
jgi:hypothetical protein